MKQSAAELLKKDNIGKAGGYLGIITAFIAYYCGLAELLTADDLFQLPLGKHHID
jgi:succinate-acetate transporter protein